jgi:centromeric protein E
VRVTLEEERKALAAFVSKFDSLGLGLTLPPSSKIKLPMPTSGAAAAATFAQRRGVYTVGNAKSSPTESLSSDTSSPMRLDHHLFKAHPSLLEQMPEEEWSDVSFDTGDSPDKTIGGGGKGPFGPSRKGAQSPVKEVLGDKENIRP